MAGVFARPIGRRAFLRGVAVGAASRYLDLHTLGPRPGSCGMGVGVNGPVVDDLFEASSHNGLKQRGGAHES